MYAYIDVCMLWWWNRLFSGPPLVAGRDATAVNRKKEASLAENGRRPLIYADAARHLVFYFDYSHI